MRRLAGKVHENGPGWFCYRGDSLAVIAVNSHAERVRYTSFAHPKQLSSLRTGAASRRRDGLAEAIRTGNGTMVKAGMPQE